MVDALRRDVYVPSPVPVEYHWPTVIASLVAAVFSYAAGLFVVSRRLMGWIRTLCGGALMGGGIVALHYIARWIRCGCRPCVTIRPASSPFRLPWRRGGLCAGAAARLHFPGGSPGRGLRKGGSAMLMGAAIAEMHYTAMAASTFTRSDRPPACGERNHPRLYCDDGGASDGAGDRRAGLDGGSPAVIVRTTANSYRSHRDGSRRGEKEDRPRDPRRQGRNHRAGHRRSRGWRTRQFIWRARSRRNCAPESSTRRDWRRGWSGRPRNLKAAPGSGKRRFRRARRSASSACGNGRCSSEASYW